MDEFHIHGEAPGAFVGIRKSDGVETESVLLVAPEGKPLPPGAEFIHGMRRPGNPKILDLESVYKAPKGPGQVATPQYRKNYDQIFNKNVN